MNLRRSETKYFVNEERTLFVTICGVEVFDTRTGKVGHDLKVILSTRVHRDDLWGPPIELKEEKNG